MTEFVSSPKRVFGNSSKDLLRSFAPMYSTFPTQWFVVEG